MNNVHVHLHRIPAALLRKPSSTFTSDACACHTRDTDKDDGGKWVTINGAAVHISDKGHIDKGPKELVGKHENEAHAEHHKEQSKLHSAAASAKGPQHADFKGHQQAAAEHAFAAHHFRSSHQYAQEGNLNAAKNTRKRAEEHAAKAAQHSEALKKANPEATKPTPQKEKPAAHAALHADAGDDVEGSEPHAAEHKRLVQQYNKAGADWERHAINNKISENATAATKVKADNAHKRAKSASEAAHESDDPADHQRAKEAIDAAKAAHSKAGRGDDDEKMKELDKLRKPHHAKTLKEKAKQAKAAEKVATKQAAPGGPAALDNGPDRATHEASKLSGRAHIEQTREAHEEAEKAARHARIQHRAAADAALDKGDHATAKKHDAHAYRLGEMAESHKRYAAQSPSKKLRDSKERSARNARLTSSPHGGSALEKIAAKHLRKAAEESADQDPKHKK
jgi:hypothetical protein